jgi:hypothetical protein
MLRVVSVREHGTWGLNRGERNRVIFHPRRSSMLRGYVLYFLRTL